MALFDFLPKIGVKTVADLASHVDFSNLMKWLRPSGHNDDDLTLNVMMVGGRRCGKTSVLASMQLCFEDVCSQDTNLMLNVADHETLSVIEQKCDEMARYFANKGIAFVPDNNPTRELTRYGFDLKLRKVKGKEAKSKGNQICINFIDYPGEWLTDNATKEELDQLTKCMRTSHIMIVAIDTPYMIEEDGQYGEFSNRYYRTTEMIKRSGFADEENMILFVPLKCERYYNDGEMDVVENKVREVYKNLIQYIQSGGKCAAAITPILTLGGAAFSRFERNEDGEINIREGWGIPDKAIYYFPDDKIKRPTPKFCEQPLFYTLAYALRMAEEAKREPKGGSDAFIQWFRIQFLRWPTAEDFKKEFDKIHGKMKTNGDGFCVLTRSNWLKA